MIMDLDPVYLDTEFECLEAISKKSFGPISLLEPRFHAKPDDPPILILQGGPSRVAG
jgi:hypothetical protein